MWGKKITLFLIAYVLFWGNSVGQKYIKPIENKYIHSRYIDEKGEELLRVIVPGNPPPSGFKERKAVAVSSSAVIISDVPALSWCFGCTATSAAMLAGYYDRQGYVNMYAGPTSGGVFPINPNYSSAEELGIIIYGGIFYLLVLIKFAPNTDGLIQNI